MHRHIIAELWVTAYGVNRARAHPYGFTFDGSEHLNLALKRDDLGCSDEHHLDLFTTLKRSLELHGLDPARDLSTPAVALYGHRESIKAHLHITSLVISIHRVSEEDEPRAGREDRDTAVDQLQDRLGEPSTRFA